MANNNGNGKSLESWIWDAACSIRGAKDAPKYKDYILPLIFTKRLCDVFDDEVNRIATEVGSRNKAFQLVKADHKLVRFYLPLLPEDPDQPVWSLIRKLSDRIGEGVTTHMRAIARENPLLQGIIDRIDFNATTHGQRDLDDDRLSNLIEAISTKRLGLEDVEADIIGKSYEYLIRKFAEGGGQSAGEFYTPPEVGTIMSRVLQPEPGMEIYDPTCGSGGLLVKCEIAMEEKRRADIPVRHSNSTRHSESHGVFETPPSNSESQGVLENPLSNSEYNGGQECPPPFTFNDRDVDNLIEHFRDPERRKAFFKEYKEIEMLYEIISPDAFLRAFIGEYATLSAIYDVVRKAYTKRIQVDRDFQRKTNKLVQDQVGSYGIGEVEGVVRIDAETIDIINAQAGGKATKVINLVKSIEKIAEDESDDPFLIAMAERAQAVQESFESRQTTTVEALAKLMKEVEGNEVRKKAQAEKGFDGLTYFVYRTLLDEKIGNAEEVSRQIRTAFVEFPNWQKSEAALRELRKKITFAIYAQSEDLGRVTGIVDYLFRLLERANRI